MEELKVLQLIKQIWNLHNDDLFYEVLSEVLNKI